MEHKIMKGLIRGATVGDINDLARMAKAFHGRSDDMPFGVDDFIRTAVEMMMSPIAIILIYKEDGNVYGSIGGVLAEWFTSRATIIAYESWWWVDPDMRGRGVAKGLLNAYMDWAKGEGAEKAVMIEFSGDLKPMAKYYKRMGFSKLETRYIKDI